MRIGMILDAAFPPDVRVENEALSLIEEGHEVLLFSLDFSGRSGESFHKGIRLVRYPAGNWLYKLSALAYTVPFYHGRVALRIENFMTRFPLDVLHVHDMVVAEAAFIANRRHSVPLVLDLHEHRPEIMKEYRHATRWTGRALIDLQKWRKKYYELAQRADRVVVVTEAAKADIVETGGVPVDKVIVVPNTVKISEFLTTPIDSDVTSKMSGSFNVIYVGDTSIRRGTDTMVEAACLVRESIPNVRFWIVGKSSADKELTNLSKTLGVDDIVAFEGWQHPNRLLSYLQSAQVALSPLKRNLHHDTTYANKIFQYMACGVPLVVSDCTAQADLVVKEDCGLVFEALNPNDLAKKILSVYGDSARARALGEHGRRAVSARWNWDKTAADLLGLYRTLTSG